jgi:hypothetical protein
VSRPVDVEELAERLWDGGQGLGAGAAGRVAAELAAEATRHDRAWAGPVQMTPGVLVFARLDRHGPPPLQQVPYTSTGTMEAAP